MLDEVRRGATDRTASLRRAKKHPRRLERGRQREGGVSRPNEDGGCALPVRESGVVPRARRGRTVLESDGEVPSRGGRRRRGRARAVDGSETPRWSSQCADSVAACSPRPEGFAAKRCRASHSRDGSHRRAVYPLFFKPDR